MQWLAVKCSDRKKCFLFHPALTCLDYLKYESMPYLLGNNVVGSAQVYECQVVVVTLVT